MYARRRLISAHSRRRAFASVSPRRSAPVRSGNVSPVPIVAKRSTDNFFVQSCNRLPSLDPPDCRLATRDDDHYPGVARSISARHGERKHALKLRYGLPLQEQGKQL